MGAYDTRGGTPLSPPNEERPLSAKDFRDMILNVVNAEPSLGNTCDIAKTERFGDVPGDPHGPRIHITLESGERFAVIVQPLGTTA